MTKRILVIEDEPQMLLGLRDNLELEGYEVITAADGEDGLAKAVSTAPAREVVHRTRLGRPRVAPSCVMWSGTGRYARSRRPRNDASPPHQPPLRSSPRRLGTPESAVRIARPPPRLRSFTDTDPAAHVCAGRGCHACRVRANVTLSGVIGYGRVSTHDQNPDAQHDALAAAGCAEVFIDKASGKLAGRPELDKALMVARGGDQLVVTKLDRLGRP